ncbi:DUF4211 domain-containing protein [Mycena kentingensis (nom. inval.)]|nr:DUF4211 domain-containing protein [Mycena kentingensis (nom. inval.)]
MGKRKHATTAEPVSPRKKARRAAKKNNVSDSDSVQIIEKPASSPARKRTRRPAPVDSEDEGATETITPASKSKTRVKPKPVSVSDEEEEEESFSVKRRKVVVAPESDEDEKEERPRKHKRLQRASSPAEDDGSLSDSPRKSRFKRKGKGRDEDKYKLDSDDEDLLVSPPAPSSQPSSSQPSKRDLKLGALQRYARARKTRSSPPPIPEDAQKETELDFEPFPEVDEEDEDEEEEEEEEDVGVDEEEIDDSFIVDEGEDDDANAELNVMRYANRSLEENFEVFVEYIVTLNADPDWKDKATEDDKAYFSTAVKSLRRNIEPLADSMVHTHWKAPYICTLNLRPSLQGGLAIDGTGNCHACWTRGKFSCDLSGSYEISTNKGTYDHDTFLRKKEKGLKYGTKTSFENNAEARNLPYPPGFKLAIGKRCFNRTLAYHEVRHYLYNLANRIRERISALCEENEDLQDDVVEQLKALKEEKYADYLWTVFRSDKQQWSTFASRKDQDIVV